MLMYSWSIGPVYFGLACGDRALGAGSGVNNQPGDGRCCFHGCPKQLVSVSACLSLLNNQFMGIANLISQAPILGLAKTVDLRVP